MRWCFVHKTLIDSIGQAAYRNQFIDTALWMLQLERTGTRAAKLERLQTAAKSSGVRLVPGVFACAQRLTGSLACSRM